MKVTERAREQETGDVQPLFSTVAMDITSFCNLRCPFCLSSHALPKVFMSEEVFDKAISLIPLAIGNNFLFSCLYEPTLHPDFLSYIYRIPQELRQKVFFSTNLAKKITDDVFEGLSTSGLHHINISLDSLDSPTYELFRKGARFSVFHDNLTRLVEIFSTASNPPELYYISVVNKLNYHEMPSLLEQCFTRYLGAYHDLREYWLLTHQRKLDWCVENKLSAGELQALKDSLSGLPYDFSFSEAGRDLGTLLPGNNFKGEEVFDEAGRSDNPYFNPYEIPAIRIQADGKVDILGRSTSFYLQDIESPLSFMSDFYSFLKQDIEKTDALKKIGSNLLQQALEVQAGAQVQYNIDEVLYDPKTLKIRGWCFHKHGRKLNLSLKISDIPEVPLAYTPLQSPDVETVHGEVATQCRFEVRVNLNYNYSPEDLTGATLSISPEGDRKKAPLPGVIRNKLYKRAKNCFS